MTYCANLDAGRISCSNSLNMLNIRLIRAQNPSRPQARSLRPPFSDSLLEGIDSGLKLISGNRCALRTHRLGSSRPFAGNRQRQIDFSRNIQG
jgi:hypothetical protein